MKYVLRPFWADQNDQVESLPMDQIDEIARRAGRAGRPVEFAIYTFDADDHLAHVADVANRVDGETLLRHLNRGGTPGPNIPREVRVEGPGLLRSAVARANELAFIHGPGVPITIRFGAVDLATVARGKSNARLALYAPPGTFRCEVGGAFTDRVERFHEAILKSL